MSTMMLGHWCYYSLLNLHEFRVGALCIIYTRPTKDACWGVLKLRGDIVWTELTAGSNSLLM